MKTAGNGSKKIHSFKVFDYPSFYVFKETEGEKKGSRMGAEGERKDDAEQKTIQPSAYVRNLFKMRQKTVNATL